MQYGAEPSTDTAIVPDGSDALDAVTISVLAQRWLRQLLDENPDFERLLLGAKSATEALVAVKAWVLEAASPEAKAYFRGERRGHEAFAELTWSDYAAIRMLDYVEHAGLEYVDLNLRGRVAINNPIKMLWLATTSGTGGAKPGFFEDMLHLLRQLDGRREPPKPSRAQVLEWMQRHPSGLESRIVKLREANRERIIHAIIDRIEAAETPDARYVFESGLGDKQKYLRVLQWWKEARFHLKFAARSPAALNQLLGGSLDPDTLKVLEQAAAAGIPTFVNPYYLSLLHVQAAGFGPGADLPIRHYVLYSPSLVKEFGHIVAWEKEDLVEPGQPNAAGWLLPSHHSVHRRYPEVAILIPETMGRACGGLCASCQRMYDFQRGNLNFDLDKLRPRETWPDKLERLLAYFEQDTQLRDILITGGDSLMSTDSSLERILDAVYRMAERKREANRARPESDKYAELVRVRLGTRLPAYLPQRVTPELTQILADFKARASRIGIRQFVIQTHFESAIEVTPEATEAVRRLLSAGWAVTNQLVFTAAASRRGHAARLRQVLEDIGVLPYYTFTVKGYMENRHNFATNARIVQEQVEEKVLGEIPEELRQRLGHLTEHSQTAVEQLRALREQVGLPFLAMDRSVLNLPGVGKSLTFRVVGITRYGRRILEFEHDATRRHSPGVDEMGKVVVIESKSMSEYLAQLRQMGEAPEEYERVFGYSIGETEPRVSVYEYPPYDFEVTSRMSNLGC